MARPDPRSGAAQPESHVPAVGRRAGSVVFLSLVGAATRVALIGVTLANAVILARVLGPRGVGEFFLLAQVVAILAVVGEGGLSHSAAAFFGRSPLESSYLHGLMLRILSVSVTVTLVLAAVILTQVRDLVLPDFRVELLWVALATVPFAVYANVWIAMMASLGRIAETSAVLLASAGLWLA